MVEATIVAAMVAAIRDAVDRIREVLPGEASALKTDRTAREVVILNLFVALQETWRLPPTGWPTRDWTCSGATASSLWIWPLEG